MKNTHTCILISTCMYLYINIWKHICIYMHTHMHVHSHANTCIIYKHLHTPTHMHTYTHVYSLKHTYTYTQLCVHAYTYMYTYFHMHIHMQLFSVSLKTWNRFGKPRVQTLALALSYSYMQNRFLSLFPKSVPCADCARVDACLPPSYNLLSFPPSFVLRTFVQTIRSAWKCIPSATHEVHFSLLLQVFA